MSLLIKNGTSSPPPIQNIADILCEDETITAIGPGLDRPRRYAK